jgi:hypothetical protein
MKRLVALVSAACMLSAGCTYTKEEPGLFRTKVSQSPTVEQTAPPAPTNPKLPVAAEAEWTTAEGLISPLGSLFMPYGDSSTRPWSIGQLRR